MEMYSYSIMESHETPGTKAERGVCMHDCFMSGEQVESNGALDKG